MPLIDCAFLKATVLHLYLLFLLELEDLLDFFVDVPHEIFLGAIVQQRANKLWIGVVPP
jgi:hypothetical protein